ncbi:WD40-repeat-containing domain protein [Sphaerosporella brunnea]|uniref:WD40-repeat-containing domain protein n=1 Tax=Sphaerosporella brunnea TaxID=1250544 RepID=A0A5J5F6C7_9PEZI|nr:WD40-repeat-containing domain protein [Sphaerosporella brunnea]
MATAAVHTPVKSHSNIFSSKHAGGRVPLTPSPRTRAVANHSPFTPPAPARRDPEWQAEKKKQGNASRGSLHDTFSSMSLSTTKRSTSPPPAAKASAATSASPPLRLDLGLSDWNLPGASKPTTLKKARSAKPTKSTVRINGDRFIPSRSATSPTAAMKANHTRPGSRSSTHDCANSSDDVFGPDNSNQSSGEECEDYTSRKSPKSKAYEASIAEAVGLNLGTRILAFKPAPPESSKPIDLRTQYNRPLKSTISAQTRRRILTAPERVLDAPGLLDDYYLNLLDWGSSNQVAIGLERNVYVWNAETGSVSCLLETTPDTYVSSVRWSQDGSYVSVGLGTGDVQIWDVEEGTKLRTMTGHDSRVGVMSWNKATLSTGSRSGNIFNHDVRIAEHKTAELLSHTSEVCGLEWRSDGAQLASGGNDNLVNIWDARQMTTPKFSKTNHKAAVKALAWCPWQNNLLASGGGTFDRQIHFWNTTTGARVNSVDAGSQVTSLRWSTHYREIVSCHGAPDNQLTVWSYPTLVKNVEIPAHETRVLHAALSPDGQILATAASDENLKFWKIFEKKAGAASSSSRTATSGKGMTKQMTIR